MNDIFDVARYYIYNHSERKEREPQAQTSARKTRSTRYTQEKAELSNRPPQTAHRVYDLYGIKARVRVRDVPLPRRPSPSVHLHLLSGVP